MQPFDFGLQRWQAPGGSLDQQQELPSPLDLALPAIHRPNRIFQQIGTRSQPPRDDLSRDSLRLGPRTARHEHHDVLPSSFCRHRRSLLAFTPLNFLLPCVRFVAVYFRRQDTIRPGVSKMAASPIKFGTSGWRGIIAEDFTFPNVRIAVAAIADHVLSRNRRPTLLVAHDTRFFSEEFAQAGATELDNRGVHPLLCTGATPTPAVAYEIRRRKVDGAINFTASHNPAEYHGLKFSAADGGPALPEVTHDIEARAAKLYARPAERASAFPSPHDARTFEQVDIAPPYLSRLGEQVRFDELKKKNAPRIVYDALHGCGAGYLDRALQGHGIAGSATIRAERDVLFEGSGADVSEENLKRLSEAVISHKAQIGLATDGDADRFGIVDAQGRWISPNHILGLLYDYLIESRGWNLDAARSVATSHLLDAVAAKHGRKVRQTAVGFKYIGYLILQGAIALGGEESAGLSIRGHIPEKDGILACLLVAEMIAARQAPLDEQLRALFRRVGREYWPLRTNLYLTEDVMARAVDRLKSDFSEFLGRRVAQSDRTDGLKLVFDDGSWILLRLSGTERLMRLYTESPTAKESAQIAEAARKWIFAAAAGG
jgi:phosphoglucomutase